MTRAPATMTVLVLLAVGGAAWAVEMGPLYATPQECPTFRDIEFLFRPLSRAYPGTEYNVRPCVRGGTYPYTFRLAKAPAGMTVDARMGTIRWRAPKVEGKAFDVAVEARDAAGKAASQSFRVTVTKRGFYFVDPRRGDDESAGTFAKPWKTLMRVVSGQGVADPAEAIVYLRGGTYTVSAPAKPGKTNANVLTVGPQSPRKWLAWPTEKPVIDLGWSREKWQAVLEPQKRAGAERPRSNGYGHRILLTQGTDGCYFDGLEIKNACYYMFLLWGPHKNMTWRRCNLHHLYADYFENPAFLFTAAVGRKGDFKAWGVRPKAKCHERFVIQDCHFHDRPYWSPRGWHGGGFVFYTVRDSLVEDCLFEKIERGVAFMDKDNGWANTYRHNVLRGDFMAAAQWCNDEIDFHHNYVEGNVTFGHQPGWVRNVWVHHNTIRGQVSLMGGGSRPAEDLPESAGPCLGPKDPTSQKAIREFPAAKRTIHFYRNIVAAPGGQGPSANVVLRLSAKRAFAAKWRYVSWDHNLVDSAARIEILWHRFADFALVKACGYDDHGVQAPVQIDDQGRLPKSSKYFGMYGR